MGNENGWRNQADGFRERVDASIEAASARTPSDFDRRLTPADYRFLVEYHIDPLSVREKQRALEARQRGNVLRAGTCLVHSPEERLIDDMGLRPEVDAWKERRLREMQPAMPMRRAERLVLLGVAVGAIAVLAVALAGYFIAQGRF